MVGAEPQEIVEDLDECLAAARRPRRGARYRIAIGDANLDFVPFTVDDPIPTGRQILDAAGLRPVEDHLLLAILENGALEEIRLDETVDLWQRRVTRFVAFASDRSYRLLLDGRRFEWGQATINGAVLKKLAGVDGDTHGVWLERRDEPDLLIADDDDTDLESEDVERFRTGPLFFVCIEDKLFPWPSNTITMEEIAQLGGWDPAIGVIEVAPDQSQRNLEPGEVVTLKPGMAYGKKLTWKRG